MVIIRLFKNCSRKFRKCCYFQVKGLRRNCFVFWGDSEFGDNVGDEIWLVINISVLVGSSLSLPALQRAGRQYYQQPDQYYQQNIYNQYPSNNQYNNQDWSSSSSSNYPNVQINGNFNDDICSSQNKGFMDSLLNIGKIKVLNLSYFIINRDDYLKSI